MPRLGGSESKPPSSSPLSSPYYHAYAAQPLHPRATLSSSSSSAPSSSSSTKEVIDYLLSQQARQDLLRNISYYSRQPSTYKIFALIIGFLIAVYYHVGAVYFVLLGFYLIFSNLGEKKKGEVSAYNVFNKNQKEIAGTLSASQLERDLSIRRL
eukprot:TRINITY_DN3470_c0_g1_i1.p1 TRINITY_DN3470_c0_g1~~TRINITY_DN3470_c0_g1_i1.p1  ORF type:complete len:161 (+),score=43.53 TRINITY_DN3470_c0_g1_i1:23-484(+)